MDGQRIVEWVRKQMPPEPTEAPRSRTVVLREAIEQGVDRNHLGFAYWLARRGRINEGGE